MPTMTILIGAPGSGKSTLARSLRGIVLSTDDIFCAKSNAGYTEYLWSPDGLAIAHKLNQIKTREACRRQRDVIIDNTNANAWERQPYLDIAKEFGYTVVLLEPNTPWKYNAEECAKKTTHGVPLETIQRKIQEIRKC